MSGSPTKRRAQHDEYRKIGNYRVKNWLGEGVNGAVRLGIHTQTGAKVALKFMSKAEQGKNLERLHREMRLLALLHHPNVVTLYEIIEEVPGYYVMVLERVRKGELLNYITDHGQLTEAKFRPIFRSILSAIDYCHQNSVVHRDLKPENILLNDGNEVKVIDFGLSNMFGGERFLDTFCGSPKYAAPEIISGTKYQGPTVDVWSIGVIFYAALVGRLPFPGRTVEATYNRMLSGVVDIPAFLSPEARDFIQRILVVDTRNRMTMSQALRHPWVSIGYDGPPDSLVPPRPPTVNSYTDEDVKFIATFGFSEKDIRVALAHPQPDPIKSLYFLHIEKQQREAARRRDSDSRKMQHLSLIARVRRSLKGTLRLRRPEDTDVKDRAAMIDLSYISGRTILMGYPSPDAEDDGYDQLNDVQEFLDRHHGQNYFVWGFAPAADQLPPTAFHQRLRQFPTDKRGMPVVESLRAFCDAAEKWIQTNEQTVVVVFGKDSFNASVAAMASLQLHLQERSGFVPSKPQVDAIVDAVIGRVHEPLSSPAPSATAITRNGPGLVCPSARRLVLYCLTLRSMGDELPEVVLGLSKVVATRTPPHDVSGGCDPLIKVQTNDITILKTKASRHYSSRKDAGFTIACETVPLSGMVHVQLLDHDRLGNERICGFYFYPALVDNCHSIVASAPPRSRSMPADIAALAAGDTEVERDTSSYIGTSLADPLRTSNSSFGLKFRLRNSPSMTSMADEATLASNSRPSSRPSSRNTSRPVSRASSPSTDRVAGTTSLAPKPVLRRVAFTLHKDDLDLEKPDRWPTNGDIVVHLYQPALLPDEIGDAEND